jgi:hypothetical protein
MNGTTHGSGRETCEAQELEFNEEHVRVLLATGLRRCGDEN